MSVKVQGRVPTRWDDSTAKHITERFRALEKAVAGGQDVFRSPATSPFGPGAPGAPGAPGPPGTPGVTDHGALTGLEDNDHPQYVLHEEQAKPEPHVHGELDVQGLENRFVQRGESVTPHGHVHLMADLADYNEWEAVLWQRVLGG